VPWIAGGRTDLDNLILLCQWHHTVVHEGGVTITVDGEVGYLANPDGQRCEPWVSDQHLARHLDFALRRQQQQAQTDQLADVDSFQHPDAPYHPTRLGRRTLSTCTPARKPSSPSNCHSSRWTKINKRHSTVRGVNSLATDNT
jgi:hypothetical protein